MTVLASNIVDSVRSAFNFTVDKFPLSGPDNMKTDLYGLFTSNGQHVGSAVSDRYCPHTSDDVIALVESAAPIFENEIDVSCHFREGHYVIVKPTKDYRREIYSTSSTGRGSDTIWPQIMIRAAYDQKPFSAGIGMFRDMCQNMHIPRMVEGTNTSIRHTSGLRGKVDELIEQFSNLKDGWENFVTASLRMQETEIQVQTFLQTIYGERPQDTGNSQTRYDNTIETIVRRIANEQAKLGIAFTGKVSVWQAFNGVQGHVQHDATRKGNTRSNPFVRLIAANEDAKVREAERYAMSLIA